MVKEDGSCIHLTSDNLCGIQDTRPVVCRFNDIYLNSGLVNIVPIEVFHDRTIESTCRLALSMTGVRDPEEVDKYLPRKVYGYGDMDVAVGRYLKGLGSDFNPGPQIRPVQKPPGY